MSGKNLNRLGTLLLLAANFILIALLFWGDPELLQGFTLSSLKSIKWGYIIAGQTLFFLTFVIEGMQLMHVLSVFRVQTKLASNIKYAVIGRHYSNITPSSTGGQPFAMFSMSKDGISAGYAGAAVTLRYIHYQAAMLIGLLAALLVILLGGIQLSALTIAALSAGFVFSFGLPIAILLVSLFPRFGNYAVDRLIRFLRFIRLKKVDSVERTISVFLKDYFAGVRLLRLRSSVLLVILALLQLIITMSMPCFVYVGLGLKGHSLPVVAALTLVIMTGTSFVPTPGNAGAAEGAFLTLFKGFFPLHMLALAMLLWRIMSFYFTILCGIIITVYQSITPPKVVVPRDE